MAGSLGYFKGNWACSNCLWPIILNQGPSWWLITQPRWILVKILGDWKDIWTRVSSLLFDLPGILLGWQYLVSLACSFLGPLVVR